MISQIYGGGSSAGATYRQDFVELFNRGSSTVSIDGWSIQYASATGTTWQVTDLSGSIPAGSYFLVGLAAGAEGNFLPPLDATGSTAMSATSGKVALVSSQVAFATACPGLFESVDFVGYGAANCFEGAPAPSLDATTAALRAGAGCEDTNQNSSDFSAGAPNPRNSTFLPNSCDPPEPGGSVVISQVYGGGGSPSASLSQDFVELFNRTSSTVSIDGWSLQYASSVGTTWQVTDLAGVIPPGGYYLIGLATGASGALLPLPDASGSTAIGISSGKVALVANQTALAGGCPVSSAIVDFVGYGSAADCFEGTGPTASPGATTSALRLQDGCRDTDQNFDDFTTDAPNPRNSGSPANSCGLPPAPGGPVVISQVYGGGGSPSASFEQDFVELFNRSSSTVSVQGWSVQYASSTGSSWQVTNLSGFIPAGGYYLVGLAMGASGSPLPLPDASGSTATGLASGKVALANSQVTLAGSCPFSSSIVDLAGYGTATNCFEGTGPTPSPSATTAALRLQGGCRDTNENSRDFTTGAPNPRNSASAANSCPVPPAPVARPMTLAVDPSAGASSDGNGILESGETASVEPSWENLSGFPLSLTGVASDAGGPAGPTYSILDSAASYGILGVAASGSCADAAECYALQISAPAGRPATHWDAEFTETPSTGDPPKVWKLHLGESFADVPKNYLFYRRIEEVFHNAITVGCDPTHYCPENEVTRAEMAIFIARAVAEGGANVPSSGTWNGNPYDCSPGGTSLFSDVLPADVSCKSIHYIAAQNIASGCSGGLYCSSQNVTRAQMAILVAKALFAPAGGAAIPDPYTDPVTQITYSCNPAGLRNFADVFHGDSYCKHVQYLYAKGILGGCEVSDTQRLYCPNDGVTRGEMAKFLANAFQLRLYRP